MPFPFYREAAFPFISLGFRPYPAYLLHMDITNISLDPNQPYLVGEVDKNIFPYGIPVMPGQSPEALALPSLPAPTTDEPTQDLDIYA